jgi:hypothetical protein
MVQTRSALDLDRDGAFLAERLAFDLLPELEAALSREVQNAPGVRLAGRPDLAALLA